MNLPIDQYPAEGAANENVLFASLGAFWTQTFKDQAALKGLTLAHTEEIFQAYYDLLDAIDSYSASNIAIFRRVKWFPIIIKRSELNTNVLKFGEGVKFGETVDGAPYIFGAPKPQENNIYVIPLPDKLKELSIVTNRVIAPTFVLVNNLDIQVKGNYLYFYGDPFSLANVSRFNIVNDAGDQIYYNNPLTGQPIADEAIVLWAYNGRISTNALNYNIAYLFGVNLPVDENSKAVMEATVKLFSCGPSIKQILAICAAFLGTKPILEKEEIVQDIVTSSTHTVLTTDKHVYRYDKYYTLDPLVQPGKTLYQGDIPVDSVQYYDNLVAANWWLSKMVPKNNPGANSTSLAIPTYMLSGTYKGPLVFKNSLELATRANDGVISFPVSGNAEDVALFNATLNLKQAQIAEALNNIVPGGAMLVNPLDFLFRTLLKNNTALLKINFKTEAQLQYFSQYFSIIRDCLPKHVYFIFFFDTPVTVETYTSANIWDTTTVTYPAEGDPIPAKGTYIYTKPTNDASLGQKPTVYRSLTVHRPFKSPETIICANAFQSQGPDQNLICKELLLVRPIPAGVTSVDYTILDITKLPV